MAALAFPPLKPTSRRYTPGRFPQTEFRALNGATTIIRFGNRRYDAELQLSFSNTTDANAALVLALYEQSTAVDDWITFTANDGAVGAGAELAKYIRETGGSGLRWRFSEPPAVDSVVPGRSNLQCSFIARLDPN